jgi:hypothetical protein
MEKIIPTLWELRKKRFYKSRYSPLPIILEYVIKTVSYQYLGTKPETMLPYEIEIALPETTKKWLLQAHCLVTSSIY